jgi:multidrug efflux pump subunit AcrA (membrane-fusion protein)
MNRILLTRAASITLAALLLLSCGKKGEEEADEEAPTPVVVEEARRGPIDHVVAADAVLYPINQSNVTPKISAPVRRVLVNRGDHVKAGQVIAELEAADLEAAANESKGLYNQAQSQYQMLNGATALDDRTKAQADATAARQALDAAKKVYDNRVQLVKEGALAQKLADDAQVTLAQAQAAYDTAERHRQTLTSADGQRQQLLAAQAQSDAAKAHYENASVQLGYAKVVTPVSGIVADRPVYPGEMVNPGSPLVSIVDISKIVARANVPVKDALAIHVGAPAIIPGVEGDLPGKVTVVSPAVDANTTTVEVWVEADNPGELLKPGATVHVTIKAETLKDVIIVPAAALLNFDEGGLKVMVVTDAPPEKKDAAKDKEKPKADDKKAADKKAGEKPEEEEKFGIAHERRVTVGVRQGDNVQIATGLQEGERVIVSGGLGLDDKAKVKLTAPPADDEDDDDDSGDDAK